MTLPLYWAGKNWLLDTRRVLVNTDDKLVILSDVHIGYYSSFRAKGSYLPTYDRDMLEQTVRSLVQDYKRYHWILAGDIKHNHKKTVSSDEQRELFRLLTIISEKNPLTILLGNHDKGLEDLLSDLHIQCTIEKSLELDGYSITHGQNILDYKSGKLIIGHVHPIFSVDAVKSLFIPVFAVSEDLVILPAFNSIAGGYNIRKFSNDNQIKRKFIVYAIRNKLYNLGFLEELV